MTGPIVVGVDGSSASAEALRLGLREARLRAARVRAVHVWHGDEEQARRLLAGAVAAVAGEAGDVEVEQVLHEDVSAAAALAEESVGAALLVLGTRGRGGLHELLDGSISFDTRRHAACPVMIVTAPHKPEVLRTFPLG